MKSIFISILLLAAIFVSGQPHSLKITVESVPPSDIYLADFYGDQNHILDTAHVDTSGVINFVLKDDYPSGMYRIFLKQDLFLDVIYNQEDIEIKTHFEDLYDSLFVINSTENKIFYEFMRNSLEYRKKFELLAQLNDYYPRSDTFFLDARNKYLGVQVNMQLYVNEIVQEYPDAWVTKIIKLRKPLFYDPSLDEYGRRELHRTHYFDNIDFSDVELIRSNTYTTLAIEYMSLFSNPNFTQDQLENAFIGAVDKIMLEAMDNSIVYEFVVDYLVGGFERYHFDKVLDYIAENYAPEQCENEDRKTDLATRLAKYAELAVGKEAPDIVMNDKDGKTLKLSKLKSDYTLVLFWASWCPHCNEVLPKIHNIYVNSVGREKLEILAVSLDSVKEDWEKAISDGRYTWLNCSDLKEWDSDAAVDYNVYATPSMFLLDSKNTIIAKPITYKELEDALINENIIQ
jgi:thiol-disulfide isomerase/thioredoxin